MLVVQIAAGVVLGVLVLAWLEKRARHAAEERWRAAQGRISRREAILHPMVTEVYKCFSRESSAYHGYGEWPVPAEELPGLSDEEAIAKAHVLFSERKHQFEGFQLWDASADQAAVTRFRQATRRADEGRHDDLLCDCEACPLKLKCCRTFPRAKSRAPCSSLI